MTAAELIKALGGRWSGSHGKACCPAHGDRTPSLRIEDGKKGVIVYCYAGCSQDAVIAALQARGLWFGRPDRSIPWTPPGRRDDDAEARTANALEIWRSAILAPGTPVERYLLRRGITIPPAPTLRYHASALYSRSGLYIPCMVAAVQAPDRSITAIHRTFIRGDGQGKASVSTPKKALGSLGAGAVRLAHAGPVLGLAEGIETALSAMQLFHLPVWAALGSRLASVELPIEVREVQIFADNGDPGHCAAEQAAKMFASQGRCVVLRFPPDQFGDFNDLLRAEVIT